MKLSKHIHISPTFISFPLFGHKHFEYELLFGGHRFSISEWFRLVIEWTSKTDHAGPNLELSFFKLFFLHFAIYDNRHWNYDSDRWFEDGEQEAKYNATTIISGEEKFDDFGYPISLSEISLDAKKDWRA